MSLARLLRVLLALALLSAQQAALAHQYWHLGDDNSQPAQEQLCTQHDALGTVAGALDSPALPLSGGATADFVLCFSTLPVVTTQPLAPSSRGPPTLP